jgi:type I restriction enzyme S subunit
MSGALEAKVLLEELSAPKQPLKEVTLNGTDGIYHAGRKGRTWVEDKAFGIPFLSSTDILSADLSHLPFMSKKQIETSPEFLIHEGWTLISRSGTIGRIAYSRRDMDGLACSEHVMRVVPDTEKISPGFLFAYLSSKFGLPLVVGGTYGSIIQSIEPHHIAELPIPRLDKSIEEKIHNLVQAAADLRSKASATKQNIGKTTQEKLGIEQMQQPDVTAFGVSLENYKNLNLRLDALYHSPAALEAESLISESPHPVEKIVGVVKHYFKPPLFKRLWVDSEEYGRQFVSGIDAYKYQSEDVRYVSYKTPNFDQFILKRGWLVFQAAGQIYGLFGQPLYVHGWLENIFCADDIYRIVPHNELDGAYLYAFFRTQHGQALLKRQACGNSIPRVWDPHMRRINVVWPDEDLRHEIAKEVIEIHEKIEKARILENQAIQMTNEVITELGQQ